MRDVLKTAGTVLVVSIVGIIVFLIVGNVEYGVQLLTTTNLPLTDPDVAILYERIEKNGHLRKALLSGENLSSDDIIKFTLDNLGSDDYKKVKIDKQKITCAVDDNIIFYTDAKNCNVYEISHDVFYDYQLKYFNAANEIELKEFKYRGYYCKTTGSKYYCLVSSYVDDIIGYSEFKEAYKTREMIVIREYYLRVDLADKEYCKQYLDDAYCNDYKGKDKPELDKNVVLDNGVLYEHVFIKKGDTYYLDKSFVVSEG